MNRFALILALLFASPAFADLAAGTPKFTWTLPTKDVNGGTLPSSGPQALKDVRIYCDAVSAPAKITPVPATTWQTALGDLAPGAHSCQATATDNSGAESAKSNSLSFVVPSPVPAAPTGLTVQ